MSQHETHTCGSETAQNKSNKSHTEKLCTAARKLQTTQPLAQPKGFTESGLYSHGLFRSLPMTSSVTDPCSGNPAVLRHASYVAPAISCSPLSAPKAWRQTCSALSFTMPSRACRQPYFFRLPTSGEGVRWETHSLKTHVHLHVDPVDPVVHVFVRPRAALPVDDHLDAQSREGDRGEATIAGVSSGVAVKLTVCADGRARSRRAGGRLATRWPCTRSGWGRWSEWAWWTRWARWAGWARWRAQQPQRRACRPPQRSQPRAPRHTPSPGPGDAP